jgi:SepF-like predicted cell division protein (DUF552 family)
MQREDEVALYLKTLTVRDTNDLPTILDEIDNRNTILIVRITPIAEKSIEDLKLVVEEIFKHVKRSNGDIARLGEDRLVVVPYNVRIWRGSTN